MKTIWKKHYRIYLFSMLIVFTMLQCGSVSQSKNDYAKQRENMVRHQVKNRGITDTRVLSAMSKVKRHVFVPEDYQNYAYDDRPLPIGYGQTISQPYIVAYMTQALQLEKKDKVLEVGTGSGYQAAILAEICDSVFTIEIVEELGKKSKNLLHSLDYSNVNVKIGNGYKGWPRYSPFDAIIVTCAPTHVPDPLKQQLAEGGKLIIPVGDRYVQKLHLFVKKNGELVEKDVLPVRFVPMVDEKGELY